jgi:hypothetical protein
MPEAAAQVVTGVVPPALAEARIREAWPSVASKPGVASLGRALTRTVVLAPLGWVLMSTVYFGKLLPVIGRRYTVTNRRVMLRKAWVRNDFKDAALKEVSLDAIDDVRVVTDANSDFFRAATLEIVAGGQVALTLPGVPEPEGFRHAILNARNAWAEKRRPGPFVPASAK